MGKTRPMHTGVEDDDWDSDDGYEPYEDYPYDDYDDPPLYAAEELAQMNEEELRTEWRRQCRTHDHGVDNLPMGHPTIEDAQARLNKVEREQKRRSFAVGPGEGEW